MMTPQKPSLRFRHLALASLAAAFTPLTSHAAVLFYDGFSAGGTNPGPDQYNSDASTTAPAPNGINKNSLVRSAGTNIANGQAPATVGFYTSISATPTTTDGGWRSPQSAAGTVYAKVTAAGLSYAGMPTQAGAADIFRSGSNGTAGSEVLKDFSRLFTAGLGAGATDLYFSSLMQFDAGVRGYMSIGQGTSNFSVGFNNAGNVVVYGNTVGAALAVSTLAYPSGSAATYLLVAHINSSNLVDIYLNPTDLLDETASAGQKIISGIALTGFTTGTAITELKITANTGNNISSPDFIFDEIHGATTWADSFVVVPEPASASLLIVGGLLAFRRRR